ncbi:early nodulin-like protein 6 [Aristolochia californica]|uniref:early nodulin-like protein 6 n=1 Tax=Aristolochia californica TaxID=171875 RepID=UPI0035DA3BF0
MASSSAARICEFLFICCGLVIPIAALGTSARQFAVGGSEGWIEPSGNEAETYNEWAVKNRFQVGDSLYFKYSNDSVLVVESEDYEKCDTSDPESTYQDGNTIFVFDHYGFFYFISGTSGHCQAGQKLIVQVMGQTEPSSPEASPAPSSGGVVVTSPPPNADGESGPPSGGGGSQDDGKGGEDDKGGASQTTSSSTKLTFGVASVLIALVGMIV